MKITIKAEVIDDLKDAIKEAGTPAEHAVALQIAKDTEPYVPFDEGTLNANTKVIGNEVIYSSPYVWYLYNGKYMVSPSGKGPAHFIDDSGNEVFRYPKGSKLSATDKDLVFTQTTHGQAQSHWLEASEAQNIEKWERVAGEKLLEFIVQLWD